MYTTNRSDKFDYARSRNGDIDGSSSSERAEFELPEWFNLPAALRYNFHQSQT